MRLSIADEQGQVKMLDISQDLPLSVLKGLVEQEFQIPAGSQQLLFNGQALEGDKPLKQYGIGNDEILLVKKLDQYPGLAGTSQPQSPAERTRLQILNNPILLEQVTRQNPVLAQALHNPAHFARIFEQMQRYVPQQQQTDSDLMDVEYQKRIEEEIRQRNIMENMQTAMEYHPESFARVIMLYINVQVNGHPVKAFVDSGAQATIMSPDCAMQCNVMHLLDTRFAGVAKGVGTAKILGRVHSAQIKVGNQFLPCSFTVMEGKDVDLLFGLDMLKRHQAQIDLKTNCLRINDEEVPFLAEHELPANARAEEALQSSQEPKQEAPKEKYPESIVKGLTDLGVSREEAIAALDASNGNPDMAAGLLFQ